VPQPQVLQLSPPPPQPPGPPPAWHSSSRMHPVQQTPALHTPPSHGAPSRGTQAPALHCSQLVHVSHTPPPAPQDSAPAPVSQVVPFQQPVQHAVPPNPDRHRPWSPSIVQTSPSWGTQLPLLHAMQSPQVLPSTAGTHCPSRQVWQGPQAWQAAPPVPQALAVLPGTQSGPSVQPRQQPSARHVPSSQSPQGPPSEGTVVGQRPAMHCSAAQA